MPSALDARCPFCGAAPGSFCKTVSGATRPAHATRKEPPMQLQSLFVSSVMTQPTIVTRDDGQQVVVLGIRDEFGKPMFLKLAPEAALVLAERLARIAADDRA